MTKYRKIRTELNDLGYLQELSETSVPLVEKLLSDLKTTTESLKKYMEIAKITIEERDALKWGAEPYKCDNAKLIKECNDLHLAFIDFKEKHEKIQADLKRKVVSLEEANNDLKIKNIELKRQFSSSGNKGQLKSKNKNIHFENSVMSTAESKIQYLTDEIKKLKEQQLELAQNNELFKKQLNNRNDEIKRLNDLLKNGKPQEVLNTECCYKNFEEKIADLQHDNKSLLCEKQCLQNQLKESLAKQHEAMRRALHLAERNKQLEKELRDIDQIALAVEADCNSAVRDNASKVSSLQDRVNESLIQIQNLERENARLKQDKIELNSDLDAIKLEKTSLQTLLDKELEEKRRLIDRIRNFSIIEHDLNMEIDRLVTLTADQKRKIAELESCLTATRLSVTPKQVSASRGATRDGYDSLPQTAATGETYTYDNPTSQRNDPKPDRPEPEKVPGIRYANEKEDATKASQTKGLKPKIGALKSKTQKTTKSATIKSKKSAGKKPDKDLKRGTESRRNNSPERQAESGGDANGAMQDLTDRCCYKCVEHFKELLVEEIENKNTHMEEIMKALRDEKEFYMKEYQKLLSKKQVCKPCNSEDSSSYINNLKEERDYYMKEYQKLRDEIKNRYANVFKNLEEKDNRISCLQNEVKSLAKENLELVNKPQSFVPISDNFEINEKQKKLEREADIIKSELKQAQQERDNLKHKLNNLSEESKRDKEKLQEDINYLREHASRLESENRHLSYSQSTNRSSVQAIENQNLALQEQLRQSQTELNSQRASYNQLKNLHAQISQTLTETQAQLFQAQTELTYLKDRLVASDKESMTYKEKINSLNGDIDLLKAQLLKLHKEKDGILNKMDEMTEQMETYMEEIKKKDKKIQESESALRDLERKLSQVSDREKVQGDMVESARTEVSNLEDLLNNERRLKESAVQENKRLLDELAQLNVQYRDCQSQLDLAKNQIDDMKRQLQIYVAEVKRTEDILSQKEIERGELLEQFNYLYNNSNDIGAKYEEIIAEHDKSKAQLHATLDHTDGLEREIRDQNEQIRKLTSQLLTYESDISDLRAENDRFSAELSLLRDLCSKLDQEKYDLKRKLIEQDEKYYKSKYGLDDRDFSQQLSKCMQESTEQKMINQDLQKDVQRLRAQLKESQEKLNSLTLQLELAQEKALEYSRLNKELRRELNLRSKLGSGDQEKYSSLG